MTIDVPPAPGFTASVAELRLRPWLIGPGQPALVTSQFTDRDWTHVVDDLSNVHIQSRDGRVYLGWYPVPRPGREHEGWKITVTGTADQPGWNASFDSETPAELVAGLLATLISTPDRSRSPFPRDTAEQDNSCA